MVKIKYCMRRNINATKIGYQHNARHQCICKYMCINKIKHNAKSAFRSVKHTTQLLFKTKFPKTRITYMRHVDNPQRWSANVGSKLNILPKCAQKSRIGIRYFRFPVKYKNRIYTYFRWELKKGVETVNNTYNPIYREHPLPGPDVGTHGRRRVVNPTKIISCLLMTWWHKEPRHQQLWKVK